MLTPLPFINPTPEVIWSFKPESIALFKRKVQRNGYHEVKLVSWGFPCFLKGWDVPGVTELLRTAHRTRVCISEKAAITSGNCAPRPVEAWQAGGAAAWRTAGRIKRSVNQPPGNTAVVWLAQKDTNIDIVLK